jgi:cytoskeletal protein RodZ
MNTDKSLLALSTIRKNRGITLQQIAEATKISVRSLEAIERGEFKKLPGGIYSTSYIRQYARAIDYDESAILDIYYSQTDGAGASERGSSKDSGIFGFRPASTSLQG